MHLLLLPEHAFHGLQFEIQIQKSNSISIHQWTNMKCLNRGPYQNKPLAF